MTPVLWISDRHIRGLTIPFRLLSSYCRVVEKHQLPSYVSVHGNVAEVGVTRRTSKGTKGSGVSVGWKTVASSKSRIFKLIMTILPLLLLSLLQRVSSSPSAFPLSFKGPITVEAGGAHNIHVTYLSPVDGELSLHYGGCEVIAASDCHHSIGSTHVGDHPLAKRHKDITADLRPTRFVWLPPKDLPTGQCLHAFSKGRLVGRSAPIEVTKKKSRRQSIPIADIADVEGPWFDGVAYLKAKEPGDAFVAQAKTKKVGILGGGAAGLMTSLLLDSVGIHKWHIIEASQRVGGRIHTSYLNGTRPDQYQYQEMGPMRFPVEISYPGTNDTIPILDHRLVFQLADHLNKLNGNDTDHHVNFIPWIQQSANQPANTAHRRPDGTIPGISELGANPSWNPNPASTYSNATAVDAAQAAYIEWVGLNQEKMREIGTNIFKAHKAAVEAGMFDFSEATYIRYKLHQTWNITDEADSSGLTDIDPSWAYDSVYFSATKWRTIDQGLSRLPHAFEPHVLNRTTFGAAVSGMSWNETTKKMTVTWRPNDDPFCRDTTKEAFDYTIVTVPLSKVRGWRLPAFSSLKSRAISTFNYAQSCKVCWPSA